MVGLVDVIPYASLHVKLGRCGRRQLRSEATDAQPTGMAVEEASGSLSSAGLAFQLLRRTETPMTSTDMLPMIDRPDRQLGLPSHMPSALHVSVILPKQAIYS